MHALAMPFVAPYFAMPLKLQKETGLAMSASQYNGATAPFACQCGMQTL